MGWVVLFSFNIDNDHLCYGVLVLFGMHALVLAFPPQTLLLRQACDIPSKFSQHYAGGLPAGLPAYGFEIGNFAVQSELLLFTSPHLAALRTQVAAATP